MRIKLFVVFVVGLACVWLGSPVALALDKPEFGGNNASDYQPLTRNPQSETAGGLQPTNPNSLQPSTSGVNPQDLTQTGSLTVTPSGEKGANNTNSEQPIAKKPASTRLVWVICSLAALTAVVYLLIKPEPKLEPEIVALSPAPVSPKPPKTKNFRQKSDPKKRKQKRR